MKLCYLTDKDAKSLDIGDTLFYIPLPPLQCVSNSLSSYLKKTTGSECANAGITLHAILSRAAGIEPEVLIEKQKSRINRSISAFLSAEVFLDAIENEIDDDEHLLLYQCKNYSEYPIEVKVKEVSLQRGFFYNDKGEKKHYKYTGIELFSKFPDEAYHHSLFLKERKRIRPDSTIFDIPDEYSTNS